MSDYVSPNVHFGASPASGEVPGHVAGAPSTGQWGDLGVRIVSGAVVAALGLAAILLGGVWFQMFAVFVTAVMVWECWMMIAPDAPTPGMLLAALTACVISGYLTEERNLILYFALLVPILGALNLKRERLSFFLFACGIQLAGAGLVVFREDYGLTYVLWLVAVVVVTDIAGYFVGRALGGPKFWPKVSPKKTWSGTAGGWGASAVVGLIFWIATPAGWIIVPLSALLSFASQMGDIAESALKRRMGVKDSSTLIPGHGGLFDRFDALLGAALFLLIVARVADVPGVSF